MSGWLGNHFVTQIGILVNDVEKVSTAYAEFLDWKSRKLSLQIQKIRRRLGIMARRRWRGEVGFFDMGSLQLELIEPDQQPSTWRDYLNEHGEGPHHIAFVVEGMKEKIMLLEGKGSHSSKRASIPGALCLYGHVQGVKGDCGAAGER